MVHMLIANADTDMETPGFATASLRDYVALAWCLDLSNNLYTSEPVEVTAADNGGVVLVLTFTFAETGLNDIDN